MTVDDYPRLDVVNHELENRGYSRLDKNTIDSAYDRWYHEEKKEEHEGREEDDDSGKEVTQKALFAVFESMEGKKSEFTDDGKYPLVSKVNERLEKKGYSHTSQKQMHKAFDSWKKEEDKEEEGKDNHDLKALTSRALHSVFEDMEGKWDEFTDDHRYPLVSRVNERLEKKGYQHAAQKQVHSEYDSWVEDEEHEGEHPKGSKEVTERALHSVFEQMEGKRDEYADDGRYPLVAKVNSRLEKMGYEHTTQKKVHQEYDEWVKEEEGEGEHPTGSKSPTNRALDEVFEEMHGHKSEFTDGGKYPLVAKVNDRLAKKGYANATQKQIHKEFDSWKEKDESEEQREEKETVSSRRS
jgi:nucleoside diphosphate kinase